MKNRTVIILLAVLAVVLTGLLLQVNRSGNKKLDREKIRSEALLSEKLDLTERIETAQKEMKNLKGTNLNLNRKLNALNQEMELKGKEIRRLMSESNSLKELKQRNAELETLCSTMASDIETLEGNMTMLTQKNGQLTGQLADISSRNDYLVLQNAILEAMLADNFQIEALRGNNEKLTVVARKANTLVSSFDVPADMGENLYFKVITPDQKQISSLDSPFASLRMLDYQNDHLLASLSSGGTSTGSFSNRAELLYKPEKKLTKGIYKFLVFDGDKYMGSVQLRLR